MRRLMIPLVIASLPMVSLSPAFAEDNGTSELIEQLASRSYHTRESATRSLIANLMSPDGSSEAQYNAIRAVRIALTDESVERRMAAAEILQQLDQAKFDREWERLADLETPAEDLELPGWHRFHQLFGDDQPSRNLFAQLCKRFPKRLRRGDRSGASAVHWTDPKLDPYYLLPSDHVRWAMLLWSDIEHSDTGRCERSERIAISLSQSTMGPTSLETATTKPVDICMQRIIGVWLQSQCQASMIRSPMTRTNLLIAMRYQCVDQASWLCDRMLDDPSLPAAASVTAMLTAARLGRTDFQDQLERRLHDDRTAHVWQMIGPRKTKLHTQVRDVALALLLHHEGIDPREVGFEYLQADPRLVFRDHSLGFADESARRATHDRGLKRLASAR